MKDKMALQKSTSTILAPGGSPLHVRAAVEEGADAVYVGPRMMSGRSGFAEMSLDDVRESRKITADGGAKLYLAINRSIPVGQEDRWRKMLAEAADIKPDALIVGSWCVLNLVRELGLDFPLHASTFLGVYNPAAARFIQSLGFNRLILNTGVFVDEIEAITRSVPGLEYEIIAYGGICFNDNHRCNLPHGIRTFIPHLTGIEGADKGGGTGGSPGKRKLDSRESAFCQLRQSVTDEKGKIVARGRLMCYPVIDLSDMIPLFRRLGVRHFKIAGRERTVDFVRMAVRALRKGIERVDEAAGSTVENYAYICRPAMSFGGEADG